MLPKQDGYARVSRDGDVLTVESDSLYVALTTLAQEVRETKGFTLKGERTGSVWTVRAEDLLARPEPIMPRQFQGYEPCGCLVNDAGAHRGECPAYVTRLDGNGARYWTPR